MKTDPPEPTTKTEKAVTMGTVGAFLGLLLGAFVGSPATEAVLGLKIEFPSGAGALSGAIVGALVAAIIGAWLGETGTTA